MSDDDERDESAEPWVLEAERIYVGGQLPSLRAIAAHFQKAEGTVNAIAKRRQWADRRKAVEHAAARKLMAQIDEQAADELAERFANLKADAVRLGQYAAKSAGVHWQQELRRATEAEKAGERYACTPPPRVALDYVVAALALEPKQQHDVADGVVRLRQMVEEMVKSGASVAIDVSSTRVDDDDEAFEFEPAALPEGDA